MRANLKLDDMPRLLRAALPDILRQPRPRHTLWQARAQRQGLALRISTLYHALRHLFAVAQQRLHHRLRAPLGVHAQHRLRPGRAN